MKSSTSKFLGALAGALSVAVAGTMLTSAASPKFYADDPVWIEHDTQDASSIKPLEVDLFVDLTTTSWRARQRPSPAAPRNVNTVDEVPNSSWFTNRLGHRPMTASGDRERAEHDRRPGGGRVDDHVIQERRRDAWLHREGQHRAALVPEVRSAAVIARWPPAPRSR